MSQIFWVLEFIKLYPRFCRTIADQYAVFHSQGQRTAHARLLYRFHAITQEYNKEDLINMDIEDDDFHTESPETMQPEEWLQQQQVHQIKNMSKDTKDDTFKGPVKLLRSYIYQSAMNIATSVNQILNHHYPE